MFASGCSELGLRTMSLLPAGRAGWGTSEERIMRELSEEEIAQVSGGISGYEAAGAILAVTAFGAAVSVAPLSAVVVGIAMGSAGGMAGSQWLANQRWLMLR